MMAHNLSAHALSSVLNHLSSPYLSQDHLVPSRHIPILSVPDILEALHPAHPLPSNGNPSSNSQVRVVGSDPWELPELKWLDPADNAVALSANPSEADKFPESSSLDGGERWPFSALYAGDRVAAQGTSAADDSLIQFSLQSMVTPSPATSGSGVLMKNNLDVSTMNSLPNYVSGDFPISSITHASEWRTNATATTGSGSLKRPVSTERPESDLSQEKSSCDRSRFELGAVAGDRCFPERLVSSSEISDLTASPCPAAKRSRHQQTYTAAGRDGNSTGPDPKLSTEKGSVSVTTLDEQTGSPGRESKKSAAAAVSDHEIHIWTERERRKKMNGMFSTLHSLLPHLTAKADKSTIVDEAINYIQSLEGTMKGLLKRKCETSNSSSMMPGSLPPLQGRSQNGSCMAAADAGDAFSPPSLGFCGEVKPTSTQSASSSPTSTGESYFQTRCSPNVVLNACGTDAFVTICSPRGRSGLLCRILCVLETHKLNVRNGHISTTDNTILYMLHAQTLDGSELMNPDALNIALQDLMSCVSST